MDQIEDMSNDDAQSLLRCIPIIESRETLLKLKIVDFPTMKDETRRKLFKDLNKQAFPIILKEEPKALTTNDLARLLNQGA